MQALRGEPEEPAWGNQNYSADSNRGETRPGVKEVGSAEHLNGATLKGPFSAVSKKDDFSAVVSRSQPEEICLLVYSQL